MESATPRPDWTGAALRGAAAALALTIWLSAAIFGAYIFAAYGGALADGDLTRWNAVLPRIYEPGSPLAAVGIGAHFAAGAVILLLGPVQLLGAVRRRWPAVHRWLGRIYAASALAAGLGGLAHIAAKGTVGGPVMSLGFGVYGALTVICAEETVRHAMARRLEAHRAWAIRLFALAVGSWLYRVYYGLWDAVAHSAGHTESFDGWFDMVNIFLFYVPNLAVAELFVRARAAPSGPAARAASSALLLAAAGLVIVATWFFTMRVWGPPIAARLELLGLGLGAAGRPA